MVSLSILQSIALFQGLSQATLTRIRNEAGFIDLKKGELVTEGSTSEKYFYYIRSGWVKLFRETMDGDEAIMDLLTDGQFFGEEHIVSGINESYNVQALSAVKLLFIPASLLNQLIADNHQLSLNFFKRAIEHQRELILDIEHFATQNAMQRIGCFLLRMCKVSDKENVMLTLPCDKSQLAGRLGMRAETFSRALSKLCKICSVDVNDHTLYISSINKLSGYICKNCSQQFPCSQVKKNSWPLTKIKEKIY